MEFLQNNWPWIVVILFFLVMHASGMGCGGHRRRVREGAEEKNKNHSGGHGC